MKSKRLSTGSEEMDLVYENLDSLKIQYDIKEIKQDSGGDQDLRMSDNLLDAGKIKFPEDNLIEKAENESEKKAEQYIEEIINNILLKEVKDKMFPQRALSKVNKQKAFEKLPEIKDKDKESKANKDLAKDDDKSRKQRAMDILKKKEGIETDIIQVNGYT